MWWVLLLIITFFSLYGVAGLFSDLENWFLKSESKEQPIIICKATAENAEWVERRLCYLAQTHQAIPVMVTEDEEVKEIFCGKIICLNENDLSALRELL